jgi:hypothetical protein
VSRHLKKELAVPAPVDDGEECRKGRTAEHESQLLFRLVALLSNERIGFQVLETLLGNREAIKN